MDVRFGGDPAARERLLTELLYPVRDTVLDKARLQPGDTVLDVGTGDGLRYQRPLPRGRRALGIAVIGSIMIGVYRSHLTVPGVPADVLNKAKDSLVVAAHIGGPVAAKADTAFIAGVHIALYTAAGAAALAAVVVFLMLSRHGSKPGQAGAGHDTDDTVTPNVKVPA